MFVQQIIILSHKTYKLAHESQTRQNDYPNFVQILAAGVFNCTMLFVSYMLLLGDERRTESLGGYKDASMQLRAVSVNMHFPYYESKCTTGITTTLAYHAPFHPIWQCHNTLIPLV